MMTMRPLTDFIPLVAPHCITAPRPVMEQYLRMAAIEWCERTRAWRQITTMQLEEQGPIIAAPDFATVFEIESAYHNGNELTPTQFSHFEPGDFDETSGAPTYITQQNENTVSILPFAAGTLLLTLFLKPRSGTDAGSYGSIAADPLHSTQNVVPEHIYVQNAEQIAEGALARLLALPQKNAEWSNPKMAMYYAERFEAACTNKFSSHIKGQQRARKRSRSSWF